MKRIQFLLIVLLTIPVMLQAQGTWKSFEREAEKGFKSNGNITTQFVEDFQGNLLVTTSLGQLLKFHNDEWETYFYVMKIKTSDCHWVKPRKDLKNDIVWLASNAGIVKWTGSEKYLATGYVDNEGRMIFTSGDEKKDNPLFVFEDNEPVPLSENDLLSKIMEGNTDLINYKFPPYSIASTYIDSQNRLWLGSYEGLLICNGNGKWNVNKSLLNQDIKKMVKRDHLSINGIFEVDNTLWILTNSGVAKLDGDNITIIEPLASAGSYLADSRGNIWVGYLDGIARYDGIGWKLFEKKEGIGDAPVPGKILEDQDGNIWYNGQAILALRKKGGLYKFDGSSWSTSNPDGKGMIMDLLKDRNGNLWCTSIREVYKMDGDNWKTMKVEDAFGVFFYSLYEDSRGQIWCGMSTLRGRVDRYTPDGTGL